MTSRKDVLTILDQGAEKWNAFREQDPYQDIDLSRMKLSGKDFSGMQLHSVNFADSDLSYCIFDETSLKSSSFEGAKLCFCKTSASDFSFCNFRSADLYSIACDGSNFSFSEFPRANLSSSKIRDCNLSQCDFREALTTGMVLDSRKVLKNLIHYLNDTQLSGIVFQDEVDVETDRKTYSTDRESATLKVVIDSPRMTPFNLSYFLLAIEGTYNNLLYLSETESRDIDEIKKSITPYYQGVGAHESLELKRVAAGSIEIYLTSAASFAGILFTISKTIDVIGNQIREFRKLELQEAKDKAAIKKIEAETDEITIRNARDLVRIGEGGDITELNFEEIPINYGAVLDAVKPKSEIVNANKVEIFEMGLSPLENIMIKYDMMGVSLEAEMERS